MIGAGGNLQSGFDEAGRPAILLPLVVLSANDAPDPEFLSYAPIKS
jgi:hypothetical protein